jgi:glycosyltransferase involved in cell wall biosynthesis
MALLKQKGVEITVVCTGSTEDFRNPTYFPTLIEQAKNLGVDQQFKVLGFISREDQIQLIRRSLAIIQPSLFEGWSTVVEDARSLGKTIFLSDFPVHLEQNPPYAFYFEQQNTEQLAELLYQHLASLQPGPNNRKEKQAYEENQLMMTEFGGKILEMAKKQP